MSKTEKNSTNGYITLRQAAELSGYSPDYIGQLIRKGKISGKQVYSNPVWMTTESEVLEYLHENRGSTSSGGSYLSYATKSIKTRLRSEFELVKLYKGILYTVMGVSVVFSLFLFYVFSVNFDDWLRGDPGNGAESSVVNR